ncbi:thermonuclease NucI [Staphylococcus pettenkoferi]|uniref:thermonuclease NucI n=1 Tax=Staphylococcus pettenkoferi TaxID=170573 RepID=UPI00066A3693|nr:thermonuclease family protein [Staphylococcus pettenkoferi]MDK7113953.1 thermonuclease family protein [Staphylococcus pettenkoferi]
MKSKKSLTVIIVAIVIIGVLAFQYINHTGPFKQSGSDSEAPENTEKVHVERVVDGDTFVASDAHHKRLKVRLIGMDTPETVKPNTPVQPYGKEASNYSKKHLNQQDVYLEYDKEREDRYGRTLAYVWLDQHTMFNKELVEKGLAREKYFAPNGKYRDVFKRAERQAKKEQRNIWS